MRKPDGDLERALQTFSCSKRIDVVVLYILAKLFGIQVMQDRRVSDLEHCAGHVQRFLLFSTGLSASPERIIHLDSIQALKGC